MTASFVVLAYTLEKSHRRVLHASHRLIEGVMTVDDSVTAPAVVDLIASVPPAHDIHEDEIVPPFVH